MKLFSIALALAAASVAQAAAVPAADAAPAAAPDAKYKFGGSWCYHPGQPCYMMKRTVDAVDEFKRSAEAMAAAMAELQDE
ncbi:hypothetical protein N7468_008692 [Penicillium chermesinum]|uniref:Uncharacterized protein n=1 Tax=Penicillium chermesinum TaxID=63820 RepID=A0A9W9TK47_9EURO|nr:uncharacterized protein N7468_008692 [Penicillium chermesinum]KAJ5224150.1 hypothetical protein N7468_008692 [Penicillium chermesinum]KAJ6155035.1 hypothetical protein N7470_005601 [Penicillium chermesinum]